VNSVAIIYHSERLKIDKNCKLHEERVSRNKGDISETVMCSFLPTIHCRYHLLWIWLSSNWVHCTSLFN